MVEKKSSNTCLYLALGCFGIIVLIGIGLTALVWWAQEKGKQIEQDIKDPEVREERVKEFLGTDTLPEGYYPGLALRVPFAVEMAMLSDKPVELDSEGDVADAASKFDRRGLIYFRLLNVASFFQDENDTEKLRDFFEGKTRDPGVLKDQGINVDLDLEDEIGRGTVEAGNQTVRYAAHRGQLDGRSSEENSLTIMMMVECSQDSAMRMAFWTVPDPHADVPVEEADYAATDASDAGVQNFMGHFRLCP